MEPFTEEERQELVASRRFLKDDIRREVDFSATPQSRGVPPPPIQKPPAPAARRIRLPKFDALGDTARCDLTRAIAERESRRFFTGSPLSLEELSFLLWATQGVRLKLDAGHALRTVPSAGCRHAFETYLGVLNVEGLDAAMYRYLPLEHELLAESSPANLGPRLAAAAFGQAFVADAAVTFIWTALPYRMEWRYGMAAHKVIALDAGHVCQNLYLACEAVGSGTCAIAAYDQQQMDALLGLDGQEEFTIYLAPVGKVR